jgi:glutamate carboxypeptidase
MQGRAAHAGNLHHEGVNAVWALARFVDGAQQLTDYDAGRTVNVGRVEGGLGKNTVPDRARAEVDFRFVRPDDGEVLRTALERAAQQAAATLPGAVATVSGGVSRPPLERSPASEALLHLYGACARASGLGSDEAPLLGGGSDANNLSAGGLPCIDGLGPRGRGFHTLDEQVERATLLPKAAALARLLLAPPEG